MFAKYTKEPIFWLILSLKLFVIFYFLDSMGANLYIPFIQNSIAHFSLNPWDSFLLHYKAYGSFPYGYAMWGILTLPVWCLGFLDVNPEIAYKFVLLGFDIFLLYIVLLFRRASHLTALLYWSSPIVIISSYYMGLNDIIPITFLLLSIYFLQKNNIISSTIFMVIAISTKLTMLAAAPFYLFFYLKNNMRRKYIGTFLTVFSLGALVLLLPQFINYAWWRTIAASPETSRALDFAISFQNDSKIYVLPLALGFMLYWCWKLNRLQNNLFISLLGIVFILTTIFMKTSLGWYIWIVPFYLIQARKEDTKTNVVFLTLSILVSVYEILILEDSGFASQKILSFIQTGSFMLSSILILQLIYNGIITNKAYYLSKKSIAIGIAGDSGVGKDTLVKAFASVLGPDQTAHISGDNYHNWDRNKPMWKIMTHLNPLANNLAKYNDDVASLIRNKLVYNPYYDHKIGKMVYAEPIKSAAYIIHSGLHSLFSDSIRALTDIKIYISMDEETRKHLKISRDSKERGHSVSKIIENIQKRYADAAHYIYPQKKYADIWIHLEARYPLNGPSPNKNLGLTIYTKNSEYLIKLYQLILSYANVGIEYLGPTEQFEGGIKIYGDVSPSDVKSMAMFLDLDHELLAENALWQGGTNGIAQLAILMECQNVLMKRMH